MEADHKKVPFDLLVHAGDISYASTQIKYLLEDGQTTGTITDDIDGLDDEFEPIWDAWARQVVL